MGDIINHPNLNYAIPRKVANSNVENWSLTNVCLVKCNFIWTITNFSYCQEKVGEIIQSPQFFSKDNDGAKWCLKMNPRGLDEESKDYVSLYVVLVSCDKYEIKAKFRLSLINSEGKETKAMESHKAYTFNYGKDWGFKKFIKRDFLFDENNSVMVDDKLTLFCEITAVKSSVSVCGRIDEVKMNIPECRLKEDIEELLYSKEFCDVTLSTENQEFPAHKAILAARSAVFSAMFKHNLEEGNSNRVNITDIKNEVLCEMLRFIYSGKVNNLEEIADDLLAAADKYDLKRLKVMCEDVLCKKLCEENVLSVLILADLHCAVKLKAQAIALLTSTGTKNIVKTDGWKSFTKSHPHLVAEAFSVLADQEVPYPLHKRIKHV